MAEKLTITIVKASWSEQASRCMATHTYVFVRGPVTAESVIRWKYQRKLELHKESSLRFGNDSKVIEISLDVTIQIAPELQHRMKTDVWQYLQKQADGVQHPVCLVSYLQLQVRQFQNKL
ncbi:uncharacterized protein TNCV_3991171 [Trichonephila clavipes]|uniref:Uncharacterized protein n=1 Tax=Trichonephila clavipes TaxID=2585209 RepID=A0A8X6T0L7_TRICX|nr:uncharacterized protein TNCV_3991171 [Trichonephila clavipes]